MNEQTTATSSVYEYKAEMKQLLHLIVHSLYTHPEVFVRELVSNASDALNKVRYRQVTGQPTIDDDSPLQITITLDKEQQTFTIEDNGIGMTKDDLLAKLGTVASSGTLEFLHSLRDSSGKLDGNLIGQFGVGFYSVFMVAEEVSVETRHADPDSTAYRWSSNGEGTFSVEEIDKQRRGTVISFKLKPDSTEFSEELRLKSIIKKYSNFVDFPIFVGAANVTPERINAIKALWQLPKDQVNDEERTEFYKFLSNDYQAPLTHLHLALEGTVSFKTLLFIPGSAPLRATTFEQEKSLHLYSNKVMIQENCKELLPEYLRFIRGVVDSEDVPLNVSRETAQSSPALAKINKILTGKILAWLQELSTENPSQYETVYKNFGSMLKMGINTDYANREHIISLLRFETSMQPKATWSSLQDYLARMKSEQTEIYYLSGEQRDVMLNNPNLEYFQKNGLEVLLLTDPVDVLIVPSIPTFEGKVLRSIDKADIVKEADKAPENEVNTGVLGVIKETLGDMVEDVIASQRLVDSAATLVVGKEGMDVQMEKMMKMFDKDFKGGKKVLEVNLDHPLLKNLSKIYLGDANDPRLRQYAQHLYEAALLVEGNLPAPTTFVRRMWDIMADATR